MENTDLILERLENRYGPYACGLFHNNAFELLIATILSAQCTDERVNLITKPLFEAYPTPEKMGALSQEELEEWIKSCGFYHHKAEHILMTCRVLCEKFGGRVPGTMEELTALPGVGRKTANVVLSNAMGVPAIAVDTHVFRVSRRLGLARGTTPEKVEQELMRAIPREKWSRAHHWLIWHGRIVCKARKPLCGECPLKDVCPDFVGREEKISV